MSTKPRQKNTIPVTLPNGDIISSIHIALLPQTNLLDASRRAHIFPHLTKPLISIWTLCDNKCITVFDTNRVTIYDKDNHQTLMTGQRDPVTTLYMINMTETPRLMTELLFPDSLFANHVYETKTKQDLIIFYHAVCFSPFKSNFIQAIRGNAFTSCPDLTSELVTKYLHKTEANAKVHIKQKSKGTNSTQPKQTPTSGAIWSHQTKNPTSFFLSHWLFQPNLH